jgi:hypothetical protein
VSLAGASSAREDDVSTKLGLAWIFDLSLFIGKASGYWQAFNMETSGYS